MTTRKAACSFLLSSAIALLIAGCSSGPAPSAATTGASPNGPASPSTTASLLPLQTPVPTPTPTKAPLEAAGVIGALKTAALPVTLAITYTAANDPNHLLGRPNGYLSKASFTDQRVTPSEATDGSLGSVDLGGSVEVFASSSGATARAQYIQQSLRALPILGTEFDYVAGSVLVRVSGLLTPDEAAGYQTVIAAIVGAPASLVTVS